MATVKQTVTLYPNAFVSGAYSSISNQNNPVGKGSTSTAYVNAYIKTGSRAESNLIYSFDTSAIPANATIVSVTCSAKAYISNTQSNRITTRTIQLYSGSTAKGSAYTISTSTTAFNMTCGTWTRAELSNCRIVLTAIRGTSNTNTNYYLRFYGATLTITYEYDDGAPDIKALVKVNGAWKEGKIYKKINGAWVEQKDISANIFESEIYLKR